MKNRFYKGTVHGIILVAAGIMLAGGGCVGYRVGTMLPPDIKTIAVPTFINKTTEPQLEVATTQAAVQQFQRDGSLEITQKEYADALLEVTLTHFELIPMAYDKDRGTTAQEYRILIHASVLCTRTDTGEVLAEDPQVEGRAIFLKTGDLSSSKRTELPEAAKHLAHNIVKRVVDAW